MQCALVGLAGFGSQTASISDNSRSQFCLKSYSASLSYTNYLINS